MVNNVSNNATMQNIVPAKASQGDAPAGNVFQDIFSSLHNFDLTSAQAVPDTKSFQVEPAPARNQTESPTPVREKETRNVEEKNRNDNEPKEVAEKTDQNNVVKEETLLNNPVNTAETINSNNSDEALIQASQVEEVSVLKSVEESSMQSTSPDDTLETQQAATQPVTVDKTAQNTVTPEEITNEIPQAETIQSTETAKNELSTIDATAKDESAMAQVSGIAAPLIVGEATKAQVSQAAQETEIAVQPMVGETTEAQMSEIAVQPAAASTATNTAVQQGQNAAAITLDTEAKRTVNIPQANSGITEKMDEKALMNAEEGSGKQNLAGGEKGFGSNQQQTSDESSPKSLNAQNASPNQVLNTLKQPSFKESVDRAMKVEAKTSEAVGNQTSQEAQKSIETKLNTVANIERPQQAAKFAQSVGHSIRNMKFNPGKNEMTIRIDPPQLGKLKINVSLEQGKINTSIVAESHAVKHALESNMTMLKGSLEQNGLKLENLTVTVNDDSRGNINLGFGDKRNNNGANGNGNNEKTARNFEDSEIEQYLSLNNYRAESKGVYFVSTTA